MQPPPYFEDIRQRAKNRWDQLEADPELAAPWHQLFKQVQSPRHVISELLQNADDACATMAHVQIQDHEFVFTHNGNDFELEHFASLCRFGYSNKRALHTIGFRGIGFKSIFSLGAEVQLNTETLAVSFSRSRFTEPKWNSNAENQPGITSVRVVLQDENRKGEIRTSLDTWRESPASLLFFRSLRHITLCGKRVIWNTVGVGPVANSEWMTLENSDRPAVLLIRSELEDFPTECVDEIRQERMLNDHEEGSLPPCRIEIVLGLEGRLFVVLPTGVKTDLPFGCNAPFIQDPARVKIKDPQTSPTNRWLLARVGKLAGQTLLSWLARDDLTSTERAEAYRLLPLKRFTHNTIERVCLKIVSDAFENTILNQRILLTTDGRLTRANACVAVPHWLFNVWDAETISKSFDSAHRPLFSTAVDQGARTRLIEWNYLIEFKDVDLLRVLQSNSLTCPSSWQNLMQLWAAVEPYVVTDDSAWRKPWNNIRIVPVQSRSELFSALETAWFGERKPLHSESDWEFLSEHLLAMNPSWPRFLTEQRRIAAANKDAELAATVAAADRTRETLGLLNGGDATVIMQRVSTAIFSQDDVENKDCVRLAQIAAKLAVQSSEEFEFVNQEGYRTSRAQTQPLIADSRSDLDAYLPELWCREHIIHCDYWTEFFACTADEWMKWITSGRSGLLEFPPLIQEASEIYGKVELITKLKQRGFTESINFLASTEQFSIEDWDFPEEHWRHWEDLAAQDNIFWCKLLKRILSLPRSFWSDGLVASVSQFVRLRTANALDVPELLSGWIARFRQLPCLQDTRGIPRQPVELLCRTSETESLLDVEPFIRSDLDTDEVRPLLLRLGVRDTPTGPQGLINRLLALSTVKNPPVYEVQKWCQRLDDLLLKCTTDELERIKGVFLSQPLVLTTEGTWGKSNEVFLLPDDLDVPGAAIVHEAVRPLMLWQKIGVEERPTLELILKWLNSLPKFQKLPTDVLRRVKGLLARHAKKIWTQCECWLNLEGEWTDFEHLPYSISKHSLIAWAHLFPSIKKQVADFQCLSAEVLSVEPFSCLPSLSSCLEERIQSQGLSSSVPVVNHWLSALGAGLSRIVTDSEETTQRFRESAIRLGQTTWRSTKVLETVPYLNATPVGTPRSNTVLWIGKDLFVIDHPMMRMLRPIARELARPFDDPEIEDAIKFCINRSPEHITEYLEQNFTLLAVEDADVITGAPAKDPSVTVNGLMPEQNFAIRSSEERTDSAEKRVPDTEQLESDQHQPGTRQLLPRNPSSRPTVVPLIDRYAQAQGFKWESNGERFIHSDGRWLQKQNGNALPWEMYAVDGLFLKAILVRNHCLAREPLQMAAEAWEAFRQKPDTHSLLIVDDKGRPHELRGVELLKMVEDGNLVLYPATYRIVSSV